MNLFKNWFKIKKKKKKAYKHQHDFYVFIS